MSDRLPETVSQWKRAATTKQIGHTQRLTDGTAFVSGSKFQSEHFLRLRILYKAEQRLKHLAESSGLSIERVEKMAKILREDADAVFLQRFLRDEQKLQSEWDVDKAKSSGIFAVAMELLHLIASRKLRETEINEDTNDNSIIVSPIRSRNITQPVPHHRSQPNSTTSFSTPLRMPSTNYFESPLTNVDGSSLLMDDLPGREGNQINSDLRQEKEKSERSEFSPGDEQTVNAALVALIMATSWLLGYTGRIHHDRASFSIPKRESANDLYTACVDGLIMHLNGVKCNGFMEVKRDFRGENKAVRRQIAAQMAAFIYEQDVVLAEKESEATKEANREIKKKATKKAMGKAMKGKGREAEAKQGQLQPKDGGNPKQ